MCTMMKYREKFHGPHMTLNTSWFKINNSLTFRSFSSKDYSKRNENNRLSFIAIVGEERRPNVSYPFSSVRLNQILKFISTSIIATARLSKLVLKHTLDLKHMDNNDTPIKDSFR